MGYDVHITRADNWFNSQSQPISSAEWQSYIEQDAEMESSATTEITTPTGAVVSVSQPLMGLWKGHPHFPVVYFSYGRGRIQVKHPDAQTLAKMQAIARALKARVQGDEGEFYEEKSMLEVRSLNSAQTLSLRAAILRPGYPVTPDLFPGDDAPDHHHFGVFSEGELVGAGFILPAPEPGHPDVLAYQLRGMAVDTSKQTQGVGRALTLACLQAAKDLGAEVLWCNARSEAVGFYLKMGFEITSDEFVIPTVGPHFRMRRVLADI